MRIPVSTDFFFGARGGFDGQSIKASTGVIARELVTFGWALGSLELLN